MREREREREKERESEGKETNYRPIKMSLDSL